MTISAKLSDTQDFRIVENCGVARRHRKLKFPIHGSFDLLVGNSPARSAAIRDATAQVSGSCDCQSLSTLAGGARGRPERRRTEGVCETCGLRDQAGAASGCTGAVERAGPGCPGRCPAIVAPRPRSARHRNCRECAARDKVSPRIADHGAGFFLRLGRGPCGDDFMDCRQRFTQCHAGRSGRLSRFPNACRIDVGRTDREAASGPRRPGHCAGNGPAGIGERRDAQASGCIDPHRRHRASAGDQVVERCRKLRGIELSFPRHLHEQRVRKACADAQPVLRRCRASAAHR